ncbi:sigma 54-interacting transcriptional regulator [Desulfosporosinus sp. Sb-LF]|uniref:sigma-54 interaction domain-containing protein n=1 Tax=Desulfosporosinus sp. Sb-LF TaxID=2560027 RepID=UPI001FB0B178|nr:sigma 54-interacting transcriptional regulator [Desulfosporosinus sp. Sb-LF]
MQGLRKVREQQFLQQIIDNSSDAIFVIDKFGNVLFANAGAGKFMGYKAEELIGKNVEDLLKEGLYDWSPTMKAIKTRSLVSGNVRNNRGVQSMATSNPLIDENGDIVMVITNAREKNVIDEYIAALEKEKTTVNRYKTAVEYLSEMDLESKEIVAESQQMRQIIEVSNVIAKTDSTVMLIGETGTGKEVMARHIHRNSFRSKEPFIPVNCAAIPHELLESEFFGYVRGAFSGANPQGKPGLIEVADNGTLFLDEIAELPLAMQSKLLRVLESSEVQRLGDTSIYKANVRFIAATNKDLKAMISQKLFRSDLYYRLNVIPIKLPPLKERAEDILIFAHKFLKELNKKYALKKAFSAQATQAFLDYSWPGNVRELRNVIERLVITSTSDILYFEYDLECLPEIDIAYQGTLKSVMKAVEEKYIHQMLAECGGRVDEAARRLGVHRTMLYRKKNNEFK